MTTKRHTGRVRPATRTHLENANIGLAHLRAALDCFKAAGCPKTSARVRLAISSAKGARRMVRSRVDVTQWAAEGDEWAQSRMAAGGAR